MEENVLNKGIESLKELKEKLVQLDRHQNENSILAGDVKKLEKSIKSKETSIEDEINLTIKKRKEEIVGTYNQEISKSQEEITQIQNKKEQSKKAQKSERVKTETSDLVKEYDQMKKDLKTKVKEDKIPSYANTKLFFALYMPKRAKDYGIILIAILLTLLIIPCGIYFFILPEQRVEYLVIIYIVTVLIFGGLYISIGNRVKDRHLPALKEIRTIRINMLKNEKKRKKISKNISKDKDESIYALDHYDEEINKKNEEIQGIEERKKEALVQFDNETKPVITEEIRGTYSEEQLNLNTQLMNVNQQIKENDENIKYLSRELVENYEAYLGKEFMSVEVINQLIKIMEEKGLETISQAISIYKKGQ